MGSTGSASEPISDEARRERQRDMHTFLPSHNLYFVELPILIVLISLVYSATRFDEWRPILLEALRWGMRLVLFLFFIGFVLYILDRIT